MSDDLSWSDVCRVSALWLVSFATAAVLSGCATFTQQVYTIERGVLDEKARCIVRHCEYGICTRYLMGHNGHCQGEAAL